VSDEISEPRINALHAEILAVVTQRLLKVLLFASQDRHRQLLLA
jgi:hypothetical protein